VDSFAELLTRCVDRNDNFVLVVWVATVNWLAGPPSLELAAGFSWRTAHDHRKYAVIVATTGISQRSVSFPEGD
jgi:hypothetical protein